MCYLKRQRPHCLVLFEWGLAYFMDSLPFDQELGVKFFSAPNVFPQFNDFVSRYVINLTVWFRNLNFEKDFCQPNACFLSFAFSFSDSYFVPLDIAFDLISNTFKPYTKLGNTPQSVNRVDKPVIIKHSTQYLTV